MVQGLSYRQAVNAIDTFILVGCSLDDVINTYADGAYWQLEEVERNAYPFDLDAYLPTKEADVLRIEYGFAAPVKSDFKSCKSHQYYVHRGVMQRQTTHGIEQYWDMLKQLKTPNHKVRSFYYFIVRSS